MYHKIKLNTIDKERINMANWRLVTKVLTVTGASTLWTLLSSTRISMALRQRALTSDSLRGSQFFSCSICLSRSDIFALLLLLSLLPWLYILKSVVYYSVLRLKIIMIVEKCCCCCSYCGSLLFGGGSLSFFSPPSPSQDVSSQFALLPLNLFCVFPSSNCHFYWTAILLPIYCFISHSFKNAFNIFIFTPRFLLEG